MEPVQNAGGCFVPPEGYWQRVREICDQYDVLLISDEVICSWGRLGTWFGAQRYDYQPDIITTAKGLTSSYAPMGAMIASDRVMEPFLEGVDLVRARLHVRRPPDGRRRRAREHRRVRGGGHPRERARERAAPARRCSSRCATSRSSATCAAPGYFHAIELVKDRDTKESFDGEEAETLLRGYLSGELFRRGLICRADDRGDPVIQFAPPLIAGPRAVRGDRGRPAPGARRGLAADGEPLAGRAAAGAIDADRPRRPRRPRRPPPRGRRAGSSAPVRWVHISELADPTPFLSGGELLLTTGMALDTAKAQREYVARLADHGLAGLGYGDRLRPPEGAQGARRRRAGARLPALRGAVRHAVHRGHRARLHAPGQRAVRAAAPVDRRAGAPAADRPQRARARRDRRGASPRSIGGPALVFDGRGELEALHAFRRELDARDRRRARRRAARPRAPRRGARLRARGPRPRGPRARAARRRRPTGPTTGCRRPGSSPPRTPAASPRSTG